MSQEVAGYLPVSLYYGVSISKDNIHFAGFSRADETSFALLTLVNGATIKQKDKPGISATFKVNDRHDLVVPYEDPQLQTIPTTDGKGSFQFRVGFRKGIELPHAKLLIPSDQDYNFARFNDSRFMTKDRRKILEASGFGHMLEQIR